MWVYCCADKARRSRAGSSDGEAREHQTAPQVFGDDIHIEQRRRGTSHPVFQGLSSAVLFSHDGCNGSGAIAERSGDGNAGDNIGMEVELITPIAMEEGLRF